MMTLPRSQSQAGVRPDSGISLQPLQQDSTVLKSNSQSFFNNLRTFPLRDLSLLNTSSSSSSVSLSSIPSIDSPIKEIAWNAVGSRVACTHADKSISIWPALDFYASNTGNNDMSKTSRTSGPSSNSHLSSIVSQSPVVVLKNAHDRSISAISWDPLHSNRLASCSADGTVRIWDTLPQAASSYHSNRSSRFRTIQSASTSTALLASTSTEIDNYVVRYSPCGQFLGVGTRSDQVIMYRIEKDPNTQKGTNGSAVAVGANDSRPTSKNNGSKQDSLKSNRRSDSSSPLLSLVKLCIHKENDEIYDLCWSNNPKVFALSLGNGNIRIFYFNVEEQSESSSDTLDTDSAKNNDIESTEVTHNKEDNDVDMIDQEHFSHFKKSTQSVESSRNSTPNPSHINISTNATLQVVHTLRGHRTAASCLAFDPKGCYLAVGSNEGIVSLWDITKSDFICFRTFHKPDHAISSLAISHDGAYIAFGIEGITGSSSNSSSNINSNNSKNTVGGSNGGINIENMPIVIAHAETGEYIHAIDYPHIFFPSNIGGPGTGGMNGGSGHPNNGGNGLLINGGLSDSAYSGSGSGTPLLSGSGNDQDHNNGGIGTPNDGLYFGYSGSSGSSSNNSGSLNHHNLQSALANGTRPLVAWHPLKYYLLYSADTTYNGTGPNMGGIGGANSSSISGIGAASNDRGTTGYSSPLMVLGRF